ncbi:glycerophosphodiester phosphodiesterase (plasmid) [Verrucomicrobiaceae bacterium 227]
MKFPLHFTAVAAVGALLASSIHPLFAQPKSPFHFAHRGGAHEFEENTLHAFRSSYEKGVRGYEMDIRMTRDGAFVVLHDDSLDRTHDGTGPVENLSADEAAKVLSKKQKEPLLFLDTILEYLSDKPGMYVEFEMKTSNKTLYPDAKIKNYARKLHQKITAHIPEGSTYVFTSFDQRPLEVIGKVAPDAERMLIKGGPLTPEMLLQAKKLGLNRVACKMEGTTRIAVKEAQAQGFTVTGWPGHNLKDYFLGLGLGVDAICSDVPVAVQEYLDGK